MDGYYRSDALLHGSMGRTGRCSRATFWMGRSLEAQDQSNWRYRPILRRLNALVILSQSGVDRIIMEFKELALARLSEEARVTLSAQLLN